MEERERLARFFFFHKYQPSNDALAYNFRWEDIPFDGCPSSKPFYEKADEFLAIAEKADYGRA